GLVATGTTPARPEVENHRLAAQVRKVEASTWLTADHLEVVGGHRFASQGRARAIHVGENHEGEHGDHDRGHDAEEPGLLGGEGGGTLTVVRGAHRATIHNTAREKAKNRENTARRGSSRLVSWARAETPAWESSAANFRSARPR